MTKPELQYFFDFASPYAYLGACRIESLAAAANAQLTWRPMLLGAVFKHIGGPMVPFFVQPEVKQAHNHVDMQRWAEYFNIPFRWPTRFPMNTVKALRICLQLDAPAAFIHRVYRAYWAEDQDISNPSVLAAILSELELSPVLVSQTAEPAVKQRLFDATQEAIDAGVFGAPTCIVGSDLFFGQDRFPFVKRALEQSSQ